LEVAEVVQGPQVAARGGAGDPGPPRGGGRREARVSIVERLDDAQALLEPGNPVPLVQRRLFSHASSPKARERRSPSADNRAERPGGASDRRTVRDYHAPRTAAKTKLRVGLIGEGIEGSRSPALHEEEARRQGLELRYELIDLAQDGRTPADLPRLIDLAQQEGYDGLNITHPCKQAVLPLLDELSGEARAIDAVNTVVFRDGRRKGFNTDLSGFATPFQRGLGSAPRQ